jgi:hypothetical protein
MEDVLFTIPLGLVTYAFGVSGQDPLLFPAILIAFDDANRTVYEFRGSDLKETLTAQTREDADNALLILRDKISITTGS